MLEQKRWLKIMINKDITIVSLNENKSNVESLEERFDTTLLRDIKDVLNETAQAILANCNYKIYLKR
jgi:hypothetical protein